MEFPSLAADYVERHISLDEKFVEHPSAKFASIWGDHLLHDRESLRATLSFNMTVVSPLTNFRHKKTSHKRLVFLGNFGRHERI